MSSATLLPVSEYLETPYQPDRDYVDGEVRERKVGEREHSVLQEILLAVFRANRQEWGVFSLPELRTQVSSLNYRVPDICVQRITDPRGRIVRYPPLICIEILSREDTLHELRKKVDDYLAMGVENIWTLDPWDRKGLICTARSLYEPEGGMLIAPGTPSGLCSRTSLLNSTKCSNPAPSRPPSQSKSQ